MGVYLGTSEVNLLGGQPPLELQSKSVAPTESEQTLTPDDGYVGMDSVTVGAISSTYVGSGVTHNDSGDLTASGDTVTAPAGYYAESASKSVASGSATTPATTITANPTISVNSSTGVITASVSETQSVTPTVSAGYVSSGTSGTVTVSGSNTSSLSTVSGSTVSPTESEQTAVAAGKYTLGEVKVGAISSTYVGSNIPQRTGADLVVSGNTVSVPLGYYASSANKSVASGGTGTPVATKGTVSSHSVSVTPSVTNYTGYITGGTKTGTAVSVSASELVSGTKSITSNGSNIDVTNYAAVDVSVSGGAPNLQTVSKTYTPTESQQTESVTAGAGYDGLEEVDVTVNAISSTYVGSGITRRDSTDMSASGRTVTAPSGYYASNGTYQMAESQAVLTSSVDSSGLITSTLTTTGAGYRALGTQTHTQQLTTQAAQTLHPSTTDQTIAAEKFLTGIQTFKAVTHNLTAENIKSGVTLKIGDSTDDDCVASVLGTYSGGGGGASNLVTGTFKGTTSGPLAVSIPYTGTGYPIAVLIYPSEGTYKSGGTFYDLILRYVANTYLCVKNDPTTTPTYPYLPNNATDADKALVLTRYKSSASNATSYSNAGASNENIYINTSPGSTSATIVRITSNTSMKVTVSASANSGFAANIEYKYWVLYSS